MLEKRQFRYFLHIFLQLKGAKFLWLLLVAICMISNNLLYAPISRLIGMHGQKYIDVKEANDFAENNRVLTQRDLNIKHVTAIEELIRQLGTRVTDLSELFIPCHSQEDCSTRHFDLLYRGSSRYVSMIGYHSNFSSIVCDFASGGELYCPLLGYLVNAGRRDLKANLNGRFKTVRVFRSIGKYQPKWRHVKTEGQTLCELEAEFLIIFPGLVTAHAMLAVGVMFFYFLVSTLTCVYDLKGNGFLQLVVQKGLSVRVYWLVLWITTSLEVLLSAAILTVSYAAQCPQFYPSSDLLTIFFFSVVQFYSIAAICFLITVVVKTYALAGLFVAMTAITAIILNLFNNLLLKGHNEIRNVLLFLPPVHMAEFLQAVLLAESTQIPLSSHHNATFAVCGCVTVLAILLTLYLDFTLDTGNGLILGRGYVFSRHFWCSVDDEQDNVKDDTPESAVRSSNVETFNEDLLPIVYINNLSKSYDRGGLFSRNEPPVKAISNVTVTIYESHITAILGHNSSGKSTLMNILTGMQKPTSGDVHVDDCSVSKPLASLQLRGRLGVCSQTNCLSDSLTVKQTVHLVLVSSGCYPDENNEELTSMLNLLHLSEKTSHYVFTLSGGQKRKLCVALALLGNPRVIILDEPTSGVDPVSRRRIWKLLQEYKLGRSIILSTHFMDEADTLADMKILLSRGSLICAGSSLFMKNLFDCGFVFEVTLKSTDIIHTFMKRVSEEFKKVKLKKRFHSSLELQVSANDMELLPLFASFLEKRADIIVAYGLAQPTLADIFVHIKDIEPETVEKMIEDHTVSLLASDAAVGEIMSTLDNKPKSTLDKLEARKLAPSAQKRIVAMLVMNIRRIVRVKGKLCLRLVVPVLLLLGLTCASIGERVTRDPNPQNRRIINYDGLQFSRGVCVYDYPNSKDNMTPTENDCNRLFNAKVAAGAEFTVMHKEQISSMASFLEKKEVADTLRKLCGSVGDSVTFVCPVFHTNIWTMAVPNAEREANMGMYTSSLSSGGGSVTASTIMGIYARSIGYFASSVGGSVKLRLEGVDDFRASLMPQFAAFVQIIILSIIPATYLEDLIEDRDTKVRCQLLSMGVTSLNYWFTSFIVHWLQYLITYAFSIALLVCILPYNFANFFYLVGIAFPTIAFGLTNNLLCAYVLSTFLNAPCQLARAAYIFFAFIVCTALLAAQLNSTLGLVLIYALPQFASIALTFYGTKVYFFTSAYYWVDGVQSTPRSFSIYFAHIHVQHCMLAMACHACLLVAMLALADNRKKLLHRCGGSCEKPDHTIYPLSEDAGVIDEVDRIDDNPRNEENLLEVRHIRKIYPNGTKAVRDVTFGVMPGEIFGLLGPNGAGKTTTLSIIAGDENTSEGECEISLSKHSWQSSRSAAEQGAVGYCPQHNPLLPGVTVEEHLWFYARILGIHKELAKHDIDVLITGLQLEQHKDMAICGLSESIKRRTCLAISLLGNPSVVIIDEASTGVDPEGKRFIWSVIRSMASQKRALIITTHSMEEAEALCSRVGIMNHGLMVGLGTISRLISVYGDWFTLDIQIQAGIGESQRVIRARKDRIIKAIVMHFNSTKIIEQFTSRVTFSIPSESVPRLSSALTWLVSNKESLQMKYFSFYQLSLDQVFEYLLKIHDDQIQRQRQGSVFSVTTQLSEFDNHLLA